jgi:hypothetical protein
VDRRETAPAIPPFTLFDLLGFKVYQAMCVSKWGNSLAVRLPQSLVEVLGLKEGELIEVHVVGDRMETHERG